MAKLSRRREADSIATNVRKHKPLDNAEIDRLYKRIAELETNETKRTRFGDQNGARKRKVLKLLERVHDSGWRSSQVR
jgi:hypothetical protein